MLVVSFFFFVSLESCEVIFIRFHSPVPQFRGLLFQSFLSSRLSSSGKAGFLDCVPVSASPGTSVAIGQYCEIKRR